jgi:hypothetical protein
MLKRFFTIAAGALALSACADTRPSPVEPAPPSFSAGQEWRIFTTQSPLSTLDASPGWEVATRFYTTVPGCITELHFYRAAGETGLNEIKVWTDTGTLLYSAPIADQYSMADGWYTLQLFPIVGPPNDQRICIPAGTYYHVSVNTNTRQVKTFGYLDGGPIVNGPLVADLSFYGQPMGNMPTQASGSIFFVDVTFEES